MAEELLHDESVQVLDTDMSMLIYSMPEDGNVSCTRQWKATQWKRWKEDFKIMGGPLWLVRPLGNIVGGPLLLVRPW